MENTISFDNQAQSSGGVTHAEVSTRKSFKSDALNTSIMLHGVA